MGTWPIIKNRLPRTVCLYNRHMDSKKVRDAVTIRVGKKKGIIYLRRPSRLSMFFSGLAVVFMVLGLVAAGVPVVPMVWYRLNPGTVQALEKVLKRPAVSYGDILVEEGIKEVWQPPQDQALPEENQVRIPALGVDTEILEEPYETYEEALRKGVWRTPNFGTAFERDLPMVLVAHRYGYLKWTNQYRRENSFFNLPELENGDLVEVIWDQRRYVYEVYGGEESEVGHDLTADLILYTCKYLESDVRIFKYARLLQGYEGPVEVVEEG